MHMSSSFRLAASAAALLVLAGCASSNRRAPVEDRAKPAPVTGVSSASGQAPAKVLPGAENAGKPGYYTVKPGDTLIRIALEAGKTWRDVAAWNGLDNPNLIEVGQVLRVAPPVGETTASGVSTKPVTSPKIEARGLDNKAPAGKATTTVTATPATVTASASGGASSGAASGAASGATPAPPSATPPAASTSEAKDVDEPNWGWPASGPVIGGFEEGKHKGLTFSGKAGDPVQASADGRVVYAGSGLRGYGNLVILKHSSDFLTAYAHNQTLLVKEDQVVRKGQKIAEMGSTDADRVQLHFEIRKGGKPVDPARQLPSR
ncbi:MAG: peptidoglycan DD-metalloendopeptidase family protein [Aquabacterium commune]|jgi:lipoprotein NlpD|uniref:peptidoglycan DD-metalloendopeptidase family protein n=1 Tax=Aquabacterium commune TaxID=70586 RepID=UPI003BB176D9